MTANPELQALSTIIDAASEPSREATVALAVALASPWMGSRRDLRSHPSKMEVTSERDLLDFLDRRRGGFGEPLPTDRGALAWMRHNHLAVAISAVDRAPLWVRDDALTGGWICTPPRGAIRPDVSMLEADGRLSMLAVLVAQCSSPPRDAIETVAAWFAGPIRANLTEVAAEQAPFMAMPAAAARSWWMTADNVAIGTVVDAVLFGLPIGPDWVHEPTQTEIAETELAERIKAQHLVDEAAWRNRGRAQVR